MRGSRHWADNGNVTRVKFVRQLDGLTYEFVRDGWAYGYPSYKRVDDDLWCRRLPDFGWSICTASGEVLSRPFDNPGQSDLPPEGVWVSRRHQRSYVYDMLHHP